MAEVHVVIDTGRKFYLDERIQKAFPDDFKVVAEEKKSATAAHKTGGETEGDKA